jgi:hypothetical protein
VIRALLGAIALLVGLGLAGAARDNSAAFQTCASKQAADYSAQLKVETPADVVVPTFQRWPVAFLCTGAFLDENNAAITAVATLIIAMFTVVLTSVTDRQARLTKEALIADKRAFVFSLGPSQFWNVTKESGEYEWHFRAQWQNSGDTPTKNMTMFAECEVRTSVPPPGFDFDHPTVQPGTAFIAPKSSLGGGLVPTPGRAAVSAQDILDAQANRKFIYMWGWAKYNDVFPGTPNHVTRFCWLLTPIGDPKAFSPSAKPGEAGSLSFPNVYHTEGNCADDECG